MITSPALDAYRETRPSHMPSDGDMRAARRRQNIEIIRYPAWWAYWKVRHLTWRRRAVLRRVAGTAVFYVGLPVLLWRDDERPVPVIRPAITYRIAGGRGRYITLAHNGDRVS